MEVKRVMLDTNIFGLIAVDTDRLKIVKNITKSSIIIYSTKLVRNEIKKIPRKVKGKTVMMDVLRLFDSIIGKHLYNIPPEMEKMAEYYFSTYRELGGIKSKQKLFPDFKIVACASFHNLDIVVPEDNHSMLNEIALKAYRIVSESLDKRIPEFVGYGEFKRWFV